MCGIAGIYHFSGEPISPLVLKEMCDVIQHRGPDGDGQYIDGNIGLGHRRLSIIDLSKAGRQPMSNEDGTVWITFNGEIYNFLDLRQDLLAKGHTFSSNTDTEVIVHLYEEYGDNFVSRLRGMFAFVIWDANAQRLLLVRDRLGIKPLFYCLNSSGIVFASEMKALRKYPNLELSLDFEAMADYFTYAYVPYPRTIYEQIRKLPPAHMLIVEQGKTQLVNYWQVEIGWDESYPKQYYLDRLVELLKESVQIHLISDVPIGAFLSGGVDSSTVVAMMKEVGHIAKTFSIGYEEEEYSELRYARDVANHLGTDHQEFIVRPDDLKSVIKKLIWQLDEPFADSSIIPTFYVSRAAREQVTVCLSGDGGDEEFGGYNRHVAAFARSNGQHPHWVKSIAKTLLKTLYKGVPGDSAFKRWLGIHQMDEIDSYGNRAAIYSQTPTGIHLKHLLANEVLAATDWGESYRLLRHHRNAAGTTHFGASVRYVDMMTYLPGDNLTKVDRASMLNSLEVRVPFLDHKVLEFAATIPPQYLVEGNEGKAILKNAMLPYLPHHTLFRKKMGFMLPVKNWLEGELKGYFESLILDGTLLARGFFNHKTVNSLFQQHMSGQVDHHYPLWTLVVFEEWCRQNMD